MRFNTSLCCSLLLAAACALQTQSASAGGTSVITPTASKPAMSADDFACKKKYGKAFRYVETIGVCMRFDVSAYASFGKDFAEEDIELYGNRIAVPGGGQLPLLTYDLKDVSDDTKYLQVGGGLTTDVTVVRDTKGGPFVGFLSLGVYSGGDFSSPDQLWDDQNIYNDSSWNVYPGVVEQAWVKFQNVQIGIQPSRFDFMYAGFSAFPGYATRDKVFAVAATKAHGNISVGVALEDSSRRDRDDGVLANYNEEFSLDPVIQIRARYKNGVYHASGALHRVTFDGADFNMDNTETWGTAGRLGALFEFPWKGDPNDKTDNQLSRVMLTAAAAHGALGYLGVPNMVIDYIADGDSNLTLSNGVSGLVSFEHHFNARTSVSLTGSAFWTEMLSDEAPIAEISGNDVEFEQNVQLVGTKIQAGVEHRLRSNLLVGGEVAYTWSRASGEYDGADAQSVDAGFPEARLYLSWKLK